MRGKRRLLRDTWDWTQAVVHHQPRLEVLVRKGSEGLRWRVNGSIAIELGFHVTRYTSLNAKQEANGRHHQAWQRRGNAGCRRG